MKARDRILARLRAAAAGEATAAPAGADAIWFRDGPAMSALARRQCFSERLAELRTELHWADSIAAAAAVLEGLLAAVAGRCAAHRGPLLEALGDASPSLAARIDWKGGDLADAAIGLTEADALVARTGSVILSSTGSGGRRLSVLPPVHVVVGRESQLTASLDEALGRIECADPWSQVTLVSGPSRTADIEKILVLGAHGPGRLVLIVLRDGVVLPATKPGR
jgi:L-lactate dehydrogenase complex protein LldG